MQTLKSEYKKEEDKLQLNVYAYKQSSLLKMLGSLSCHENAAF